jgi:RNA polymerase sigma-70 factor (ECF subfamily)
MASHYVEADDLTQEVFVQAHRKLGSLRDPDAVTSWLYRIATHVCYDRFRKWSRQPRPDPLDVSGSIAASPMGDGADEGRLDRVIERTEMSACVRGFLEDLSDEYRQVILLHDLEGLTSAEIAEMLGVSVDTIKIRLHRARRKLKVALAANCDFSHDDYGVFLCEPTAASPAVKSPAADQRRRPGVSLLPARSSLGQRRRRNGGAARTGRPDDDVVER